MQDDRHAVEDISRFAQCIVALGFQKGGVEHPARVCDRNPVGNAVASAAVDGELVLHGASDRAGCVACVRGVPRTIS